jgi:hypothetical protein
MAAEGGMSLAAKVDLLWKAHETQERLVEIVNLHETRLAVIETVLERLAGG